MKRTLAGTVAAIALSIPLVAQAYPFGGMIGQIIFCYNNAIYTAVGPPRGGPFIWTPSTRTYQFGPPTHSGQWLLGLAAPPYYCLVSIQPIIVWSGILMTMEGSSGGAAPGLPGGGLGNFSGGGTTRGGTTNTGGSTGASHVLVSEVYPQADSSHGGASQYTWIELYNPTGASTTVSRWTIRTALMSQTIPDNTIIGPEKYIVLTGTSQVRTMWNVSNAVPVIAFSDSFAGFTQSADHVFLQDTAGNRIDAVSFGTDTGAFSPAVAAVAIGHSIVRRSLSTDTNTASDWVDTTAPAPGR
jgi:hypothetical protein